MKFDFPSVMRSRSDDELLEIVALRWKVLLVPFPGGSAASLGARARDRRLRSKAPRGVRYKPYGAIEYALLLALIDLVSRRPA